MTTTFNVDLNIILCMRALVTGGAGYLGSYLCKNLQQEGFKVRILDSMERQRYCTLWNLDKDLEFYDGDIRDEKDLETCLKDIDAVFCLSDLTNAGKSFERKQTTKEINYEGVKKLFDKSVEKDVSKFVYTSSASVYGNTPEKVDESFDCNPISPYGKFKLKAEKELLAKSQEHDINATALRLGTVYGFSTGIRFDTVINYFTYLACQGKSLTVHDSALEEYRPYVNIEDVVRAYFFALENAGSMTGEAYNVVGQNYAMEDVLEVFSNIFPETEHIVEPNPTPNKVSYRLKTSKIREKGFESNHEMSEGIKSIKKNLNHLKSF